MYGWEMLFEYSESCAITYEKIGTCIMAEKYQFREISLMIISSFLIQSGIACLEGDGRRLLKKPT